MTVPFSNTKLRVPNGFRNLLWVLTKEVIRDAPDDMVSYCANFMEKLLAIRKDTGHDPVLHGAHIEDRFYNNYAFPQMTSECQPTTSAETEQQAGPEKEMDATIPSEQPEEPAEVIELAKQEPTGEGGGPSGESKKPAEGGMETEKPAEGGLDSEKPAEGGVESEKPAENGGPPEDSGGGLY